MGCSGLPRRFGASASAGAGTGPEGRRVVARRPDLARLAEEDVAVFREILGESGVLRGEEEVAPHNEDWTRRYWGASTIVLRPVKVEQVSAVMKYCNDKRLAVVPQGGNTGLVGGGVPVHDEIILNLAGMNRVISFSEDTGVLVCEPGCILQSLENWLVETPSFPHQMPLDLGAKGSCQIGGNLSTNAGGIRFVRYGSLRGSVVGLEAVTADGSVIDCMNVLRKDNTGLDLKQLFIGSEGHLGIITKLAIACPPRPKSRNLAVLAVNTFEEVQDVFVAAKVQLAEILSACEFMDSGSIHATVGALSPTVPGMRRPLEEDYPFCVLIETAGSCESHDKEKLEAFLSQQMESGPVIDGVLAQDEAQYGNIWQVREMPPVAYLHMGQLYTYDISVPIAALYDVVEVTKHRLSHFNGDLHVDGFGHLGDGNLHLNVVLLDGAKTTPEELLDCLEPFIWDLIQKHGGSISAEHGLGRMKNELIGRSKGDVAVELMAKVKRRMDPHGILNPYKVLPESAMESGV